ncbi:hypothetical protein BsWGS_18100 [Bradybaena similaris]
MMMYSHSDTRVKVKDNFLCHDVNCVHSAIPLFVLTNRHLAGDVVDILQLPSLPKISPGTHFRKGSMAKRKSNLWHGATGLISRQAGLEADHLLWWIATVVWPLLSCSGSNGNLLNIPFAKNITNSHQKLGLILCFEGDILHPFKPELEARSKFNNFPPREGFDTFSTCPADKLGSHCITFAPNVLG